MLPEGDTMNYSYYEGKNTPVKEAIDLAETLPFFAEHRLIVFENTGFFKTAAGADLADYIKDMPETTCFIFVEEEIDKRNRLYKAVKAKGYIAELSTQDAGTLKRWVAGLVRKEQKQISESVIVYFLDKVGTDMENIQGELEKVFCYALERDTITKEDIDAVCVTQITNHIFEMVDAVAAGNQQKALDLYYELLALKEPPMRIFFCWYVSTGCFSMSRHLQTRDMEEKRLRLKQDYIHLWQERIWNRRSGLRWDSCAV